MIRSFGSVCCGVSVLVFTLTVGCTETASEAPTAHRQHHGPKGEHPRFDDADVWADRFEDPKRDAWQQPDYVLSVLALKPTDKVADIGAATGYFPVRFARAVPEGRVYGVDIEQSMVDYLNRRAAKEGLGNLVGVRCRNDDPNLPEAVDLVFICNTYHHIESRQAYFENLKSDLLPGGRVAIVDFYKKPLSVGPPPEHKLAIDQVIEEMEQAGYRLLKRDTELVNQYILLFSPEAD